MLVDIMQLPIPNWGLICPGCRYPLRGLPEHRCPECGLRLDMEQLIQPWTRLREPRFTGAERPLPDFGLLCVTCREPLAGAPERDCPHCAAPFDPRAWRPRGEWFVLDRELCGSLPLVGVTALLADEYVPYIPANERTMTQIVLGADTVLAGLKAPSEFYFEVRWLLRRAQEDAQRWREAGHHGEWRCPACAASNPPNFEVCWSCQAVRNGI